MRLNRLQRYGLAGERWVLAYLVSLGYQAALLSDFFEDIDILVNGLLRVEVKTARPKLHRARPGYWRQRWQFDLARLPKADQDYVVICVCDVSPDGVDPFTGQDWLYPFVIPSALLRPMGRRHLQITSHPGQYRGWAAAYLERWDVIGQTLTRRQQYTGQLVLPLFTPLGHNFDLEYLKP